MRNSKKPKIEKGKKLKMRRRKGIDTKEGWVPLRGSFASMHDEEEDFYYDVKVIKIRGKIATVHRKDDKNDIMEVGTHELDKPLNPSVDDRFRYFERLGRLTIRKDLQSLITIGVGGIGKTHTIKQLIEADELEEGVDFQVVKGHCTSLSLYQILHDNQAGLVVFDDCDEILNTTASKNILQAVLDTYSDRVVHWQSSRMAGYPKQFKFYGSVVFLSNMAKEDFDQTLLSRAVIIDLALTKKEMSERMEKLLPFVPENHDIDIDDKKMVFSLLNKYKHTIQDYNLRTLIKALVVFKQTAGDMELVKYQILNG